MAVKLIASDLDGTLMAPDHMTVSERTKKALLDAHEKGIKIAIATGRTLHFTDSVTAQIPFVDYVVSSNGAAVYDRNAGEYVYSTLVPNKVALEAVEFLFTFCHSVNFVAFCAVYLTPFDFNLAVCDIVNLD